MFCSISSSFQRKSLSSLGFVNKNRGGKTTYNKLAIYQVDLYMFWRPFWLENVRIDIFGGKAVASAVVSLGRPRAPPPGERGNGAKNKVRPVNGRSISGVRGGGVSGED